jgi:hypothetical protein
MTSAVWWQTSQTKKQEHVKIRKAEERSGVVLSEIGSDNPLHVTLRENSAAWQSTLAKVLMPLVACALGGLSFRPGPSVLLWLEVNRASLWI